ncbi:hypothetical protein HK101_000269 [Irineochytrium annulatum]|nr:hypothetical protein HK101_000269 [Irineochytrium annulatum]
MTSVSNATSSSARRVRAPRPLPQIPVPAIPAHIDNRARRPGSGIGSVGARSSAGSVSHVGVEMFLGDDDDLGPDAGPPPPAPPRTISLRKRIVGGASAARRSIVMMTRASFQRPGTSRAVMAREAAEKAEKVAATSASWEAEVEAAKAAAAAMSVEVSPAERVLADGVKVDDKKADVVPDVVPAVVNQSEEPSQVEVVKGGAKGDAKVETKVAAVPQVAKDIKLVELKPVVKPVEVKPVAANAVAIGGGVKDLAKKFEQKALENASPITPRSPGPKSSMPTAVEDGKRLSSSMKTRRMSQRRASGNFRTQRKLRQSVVKRLDGILLDAMEATGEFFDDEDDDEEEGEQEWNGKAVVEVLVGTRSKTPTAALVGDSVIAEVMGGIILAGGGEEDDEEEGEQVWEVLEEKDHDEWIDDEEILTWRRPSKPSTEATTRIPPRAPSPSAHPDSTPAPLIVARAAAALYPSNDHEAPAVADDDAIPNRLVDVEELDNFDAWSHRSAPVIGSEVPAEWGDGTDVPAIPERFLAPAAEDEDAEGVSPESLVAGRTKRTPSEWRAHLSVASSSFFGGVPSSIESMSSAAAPQSNVGPPRGESLAARKLAAERARAAAGGSGLGARRNRSLELERDGIAALKSPQTPKMSFFGRLKTLTKGMGRKASVLRRDFVAEDEEEAASPPQFSQTMPRNSGADWGESSVAMRRISPSMPRPMKRGKSITRTRTGK